MSAPLELIPGRFYLSKCGETWCCYLVWKDRIGDEHCQARCVRLYDGRTEYFYKDGRYDTGAKREHTLVRETVFSEWRGT